MKLLLASQSPRRRQLLSELGYPMEVVKVEVEERIPVGMAADRVAEYLARLKATAYPANIQNDEVLVTADTIVVLNGDILGKPANREEAIAMIGSLAGNSHKVYTGVCLRTVKREVSFTECTTVHFSPLSDSEIMHYVDTFKPFDKAGAYGIQEWIGMIGISRIEGCYYNVMGLPVAHLYHELKQLV